MCKTKSRMRQEDWVSALLLTNAADCFLSYRLGWYFFSSSCFLVILLKSGHDESCPLCEEPCPYVPWVQENQGVKEELGELILPRQCQFYHRSSCSTWGLSYKMCSSVLLPPSVGWHRKKCPKLVTPVSLSLWGKAGTDLSNPTQLWVFVKVFVGWLDTFLFKSTALCEWCCWRKINKAEPCEQVSFWFPPYSQGDFWENLQRDGQASSLRSSVRLAWSGLGSIWRRRGDRNARFSFPITGVDLYQ